MSVSKEPSASKVMRTLNAASAAVLAARTSVVTAAAVTLGAELAQLQKGIPSLKKMKVVSPDQLYLNVAHDKAREIEGKIKDGLTKRQWKPVQTPAGQASPMHAISQRSVAFTKDGVIVRVTTLSDFRRKNSELTVKVESKVSAAASKVRAASFEFNTFSNWCLKNKVSDEDSIDDAVDSAYDEETRTNVVVEDLSSELAGKPFTKAAAVKHVQRIARFTVQDKSTPEAKKIFKAADKYAADYAAFLEKNWASLLEAYDIKVRVPVGPQRIEIGKVKKAVKGDKAFEIWTDEDIEPSVLHEGIVSFGGFSVKGPAVIFRDGDGTHVLTFDAKTRTLVANAFAHLNLTGDSLRVTFNGKVWREDA